MNLSKREIALVENFRCLSPDIQGRAALIMAYWAEDELLCLKPRAMPLRLVVDNDKGAQCDTSA